MRIIIVGFGMMGKIVYKQVKKYDYEIISTIDPHDKKAEFKAINKESVKNAEVAICFTQARSVIDTIQKLSDFKIKIVLATTGWENDILIAKEIVKKYNNGIIYSSNFSIGVLLFFEIIKKTSRLMQNFDHFNAFGYEIHHNRKIDHPSGTLKKCGEIMAKNMPRQNQIIYKPQQRKLKDDELFLGSIRGGDINGIHKILFDSNFDTIEINHNAKNRIGFADGAIKAASWIKDKTGFYSEQDLINSMSI